MDISALQRFAQTAPVEPVVPPPEIVIQNRELVQAVKTLNAAERFGQDNELSFVLDRATGSLIIRLRRRKDRKVLREMPPESVLEWAAEAPSGQRSAIRPADEDEG